MIKMFNSKYYTAQKSYETDIIINGQEVHLAEQPWLSMLVYSVLVDVNQ